MQSRRVWRIRILALAWPAALVVALVIKPAAQAGTTDALETKLRACKDITPHINNIIYLATVA
jgi:hypothetical protein